MFRSLESQGVPMAGVELRDGSGLSTANRVTCDAVLTVLQVGAGGPLDEGLPVAALSGTLADEFLDGPMVGRLRAKTGTLNNPPVELDPPAVKALAGYVDPRAGIGPGTIEFVVIVNTPEVTDESRLSAALGGTRRTFRDVSDGDRHQILLRPALSIEAVNDLRSEAWRSCRCFPLGSVLLPGGVLPLHVFEPRYRQMVIDCLQGDGTPEFGQALITHGSEAGGGDERAMIGTAAQMVQIEALDEERYAIVAVGIRRITINAWLPDDPYPLADVDDYPDVDPDSTDLAVDVAATHGRVRAALALAQETGRRECRDG